MTESRRPVLVLGLDGASFNVIDPLLEQGRLPNLARFLREGVRAPLASTTPPMSFPAWSTFLTGLEPGRHGLFDFTQKVPGAYRIRFCNATDRQGATLLGQASAAGRPVLGLGIPATFPPEPLHGLGVAGFDAPVSTGSDARSASDAALYRAVAERAGPWMVPDLDETARDEGWHERAVEVLLRRVRRKTGFALEALRRIAAQGAPAELAVVVFSESDTVAHHYWRDHDAASPRHDPAASARRRGAVAAVYEALDAACGELRAGFGEDALCLVVSDHGAGGASQRVVHLNRRLEECGLLTRRPGTRDPRRAVARAARDAALRLLPPRAAQAIFRRTRGAAARVESAVRFAGTEWQRSAAFSEEVNTQPGVWINRAGREAEGSVVAADYERVRDEVILALTEWTLPGGAPVVARARRREEVYSGPHVERAPDVVVELALEGGYAHSVVPTPWHDPAVAALRTLEASELGGGRGRGMNGTHRPDGIFIATGPGAAGFDFGVRPSLSDVAPTVLAAMGVPSHDPLDGAPLAAPRIDYTPDEEARVAERLRTLGYLD